MQKEQINGQKRMILKKIKLKIERNIKKKLSNKKTYKNNSKSKNPIDKVSAKSDATVKKIKNKVSKG